MTGVFDSSLAYDLPKKLKANETNMDKRYMGLRDDGKWEPFMASSPEEATPEATGYAEVKEDN